MPESSCAPVGVRAHALGDNRDIERSYSSNIDDFRMVERATLRSWPTQAVSAYCLNIATAREEIWRPYWGMQACVATIC